MSKKKKEIPVESFSAKWIFRCAIIVAFASLLPNTNTFNHGYVLDDISAITENYVVQKGVESIPVIWETNYRHGYWSDPGSLYRPLALSLFAWEWEMWPNDPNPAHVINVLLYVAGCVSLFFLLLSWFGKSRLVLAAGAALLFAIHPIHTEVVANIKSADELLAVLFSILSILAIWKNGKKVFSIWLLLAMVSFFFALTSKESTITWLPIIPLMFYFFSDIPLKNGLMSMLWMLFPVGSYMALRKNALGTFSSADVIAGIDNVLVKADGVEYFATAIKICGLYFWKLIAPYSLSHDYSLYEVPVNGLEDPFFWFSLLTILGLIVLLFKGFKSKSLIAFSILFFGITFSLYSNLVFTIGTHFGERLLFLPSVGFCIAIASILYWFAMRKTEVFEIKNSLVPIGLLAILLLGYGFKTNLRNQDWKSEFDLYSADVINSPMSARTHYRLGMACMKERAILAKNVKVKNQWLRKAVGELKKAIEIYPGYADAQGELGLAYQRLEYFDLAVERYKIVLEKKPTHKTTLNNMGTILFSQAKFDEAIEYFLRALDKDPKYKDAMGNLASCYGTIGEFDNAIIWFKKAIEIDPKNASYYYYIGMTYERMHKLDEAESWMLQAYVLDPSLRPKQ